MLTKDRFDLMSSEASGCAGDLWQVTQEGPVFDSPNSDEGWQKWEAEVEDLNRSLVEKLKAEGWTADEVERALLDLMTYGMPSGTGYGF